MVQIGTEELREIQMRILDYVDAFCRVNDIKYSLSGGSLLGAVRHGGFIPWDDDIDIQMLRSDYDKFTELWNKQEDHQCYELVSIESNNNLGYPFGKIHNIDTITYVGRFKRTGVFIDNFPLDKVISDEDFKERRRIIRGLYSKRKYVFAFLKIIPFSSIARFVFNRIAVRINEEAKKMNNCEGEHVFEMTSGLICKNPIPLSVFDSYVDLKFENRNYMAVKDFDTYLSCTFGDYMTLPPEEKRVSHHEFLAYWL